MMSMQLSVVRRQDILIIYSYKQLSEDLGFSSEQTCSQIKMTIKIRIVGFASNCTSKSILSIGNYSMKVKNISKIKISEDFKAE